jgi:hypothetical protein
MVIEFLLNELDNVERKVRRRLRSMHPESGHPLDVDNNQKTLDYHATQARVIWGLMKATGGEIQSVFERHACGPGPDSQRELDGRPNRADFSQNGKELEVVVELSKRWSIWSTQNQAGCPAGLDCTGEASAGAVLS